MTSTADWPFEDPENVAVITVRQVLGDDGWIHFVSHDADDGGWQFMGIDSPREEDALVVSLRNIVQHDPSIIDLADLPLGWCAWRDHPEAEWQRARNSD